MADNALVQTRIDPDVRDRAAQVLDSVGLTISDAVRILLTRTANEGALPLELRNESPEYDEWFRRKVQAALADTRPRVPHDEVTREFADRKAKLRAKLGSGGQ